MSDEKKVTRNRLVKDICFRIAENSNLQAEKAKGIREQAACNECGVKEHAYFEGISIGALRENQMLLQVLDFLIPD